MKTLVIHPEDESTDFLAEIYRGRNWTILRKGFRGNQVARAMEAYDCVICLGHGYAGGLFHKYRSSRVITVVDERHAELLKQKPGSIFIWCHADRFVHDLLKGHGPYFATGMFISEPLEGVYYKVKCTQEQVDASNALFASLVAKHVDRNVRDLEEALLTEYSLDRNPVVGFNGNSMVLL